MRDDETRWKVYNFQVSLAYSNSRYPWNIRECAENENVRYYSKLDTKASFFKVGQKIELCPGLVNYVMVWIKEPFKKNEKSTIDVLISRVNKI